MKSKFSVPVPADIIACRNRALGLLARREHSQQELRTKLLSKAFTATVVSEVVHQLCAENLVSDQRFAQCYVAQRARRGYGPARIRQELRVRGIAEILTESVLAESATDWQQCARVAWSKYLRTHKVDAEAKWLALKRRQFLFARGFEQDYICTDYDAENFYLSEP